MGCVKKFMEYSQKPVLADQSGRPTLENTICVCLVALAMVCDLRILSLDLHLSINYQELSAASIRYSISRIIDSAIWCLDLALKLLVFSSS